MVTTLQRKEWTTGDFEWSVVLILEPVFDSRVPTGVEISSGTTMSLATWWVTLAMTSPCRSYRDSYSRGRVVHLHRIGMKMEQEQSGKRYGTRKRASIEIASAKTAEAREARGCERRRHRGAATLSLAMAPAIAVW